MKTFGLVAVCVLLLVSCSLRAQDLRPYRLREVQDAFREKMHLPEGGTLNLGKGQETPQASGESRISTTTPESEVSAAINPTDTANIVVGPIRLNGGMALPIYYTTNFGQSWKKSVFLPSPYQSNASISGGGDPVFAYDADGKVYMTWIDTYGTGLADSSGTYLDTTFFGLYWASSTNGGQTWQRPAAKGYVGLGWERISIDSATFQARFDTTTGIDDKEWIAVDRSNSLYRNTLYVAWTHLGVTNYGVMVRRKLPGVDSMEPPVRVSSDNFLRVQYTSIGIDSKGGVHVSFMGTLDTIHYGIYQAYSSDGGKTFQPAVKISDVDIPGTSPDAIANGDVIFGIRQNGNYPCPHLSIDTAVSGNLYEVWNALGIEQDNQQGTDIYFSRSTDNGATWSPASILNNDRDTDSNPPTDHFYPSIAVNGKGMISVTWYDRREDPSNQIGRYYIAQSTDQGHTWTNAPVATQPMDFNYVMNVNQNFGIGEYTQVLTTSNYTIPVWSDGRDDAGNLRVYAAFINPANARVDRLSSIGEGVSLLDNYPNPFSASTKLGFTLETAAHAWLYITNIAGVKVASIFDGTAQPGEHDFTFDGSRLANGVYYLNLETDLGTSRSAITVLR